MGVCELVKVAPSILAADMASLADELNRIPSADYIHVDVMDGTYVPNITYGQDMVRRLSELTAKPLDVHLMIVNPELHIESFVKAGASILTIHPDATRHLHRQLGFIKNLGASAGVALNPADHVSLLENVLDLADLVLVMGVNPGFGGQAFIDGQIGKIRRVREMVVQSGRDIQVAVDGGINAVTGARARDAGADFLIAGTYIFKAASPEDAIKSLRG